MLSQITSNTQKNWTFMILKSPITVKTNQGHQTKSVHYLLFSAQLTVNVKLSHYHHHHQSLNREGRSSTTDYFATNFLHFSLFSTALWDLPAPGLSIP